ncbi:MAG: hypothetical protein PUP91_33320 [Rhizonema sp. PD37]|nr:hypothetical protein [Rhizonema sp. PD37]
MPTWARSSLGEASSGELRNFNCLHLLMMCVSVEKENRDFNLISQQPHPEAAIAVGFIEVKGCSTDCEQV